METTITAAKAAKANVNASANKSTKAAAKPAKAKAAKVNPLKEARKSMLGRVKEERQSLSDCIRLLALFGHAWLKEVKLTPAQLKALTPAQLRPYQTDAERYRATLVGEGGQTTAVEYGWTPTKVANAVQRMQGVK